MQLQRPVYWYSGQFLEPQHFQQADAFHASERASLLQSAQPCFWGVGNLDVDEAALAEGRILVRSGIMRFQDGTEVVIAAVPEDGNAILPSRSFREAWTDPHMPFTVFAGLPPLKSYGNVAGIPSCMRDGGRLIGCDADTLPEAPGRYLCPNSDDSIADRYALPLATESRRDMPVRTLYLYPRLFWENETTDRPDWLFLPLLRLTDEGSGPRPDPAYAPPSLYVEANPVLRGLARGLEARLAAAIRRLEPARRRGLDEPATSRQLLLVNAARTLSELRHALAWPGTAPRELFGLLRNGFAAAAACVGIAAADAMPLYRHDDPAESFRSLDSLLREILRGLLPETAAVVRFRADGEFLRAELPEGLGRTQALLVLQTEETVSSLLNEGRLVADAPDTLPATLAQAIAGVPLREIPAPPGLPQRDGIHYLEPDARSERWQTALRSGALGVALFPLCGPALPGHLRLLYLRN